MDVNHLRLFAKSTGLACFVGIYFLEKAAKMLSHGRLIFLKFCSEGHVRMISTVKVISTTNKKLSGFCFVLGHHRMSNVTTYWIVHFIFAISNSVLSSSPLSLAQTISHWIWYVFFELLHSSSIGYLDPLSFRTIFLLSLSAPDWKQFLWKGWCLHASLTRTNAAYYFKRWTTNQFVSW